MIRKISIFALFFVFELSTVDLFRDFVSSNSYDRHNLYFENQSQILKRVYVPFNDKERAGVKSARLDSTGFDLPMHTLNGLYSECIFNFSFTCLQNRIIEFLLELDKIKSFQFLNKTITLLRKKGAPLNAITMPIKRVDGYVNQSNYLKNVINALIEQFFDNRFIRIKLPAYPYLFSYYLDNATRGDSNDFNSMYIDIDFGEQLYSSPVREGRKKGHVSFKDHGKLSCSFKSDGKKGKSKRKQRKHKMHTMKKALLLLVLGACVKLSILGPLILGLAGLKSIKAIILLAIALFKSKNTSSHGSNGGGGDSYLGNIVTASHDFMDSIDGEWDRNIGTIFPQRPAPPSTSLIPYNSNLNLYEYSYKPTRTRT